MDEAASEQRRYVIQAGATYAGKQGPDYTPGISAESVASRALWLGSVVLPPGGRTRAHVHEHHESAFYLVSGDEVELWTGEQLQQREVAHAGDYLYVPAGVPHVAVNMWRSTGARRRCSPLGRGPIHMSRRVWCFGRSWTSSCHRPVRLPRRIL
jgi:uncharacterized RmlC-like cupin family protein